MTHGTLLNRLMEISKVYLRTLPLLVMLSSMALSSFAAEVGQEDMASRAENVCKSKAQEDVRQECVRSKIAEWSSPEFKARSERIDRLVVEIIKKCRNEDTDKFHACAVKRAATEREDERSIIVARAYLGNLDASIKLDEKRDADVRASCRKLGIAQGAVRIGMTAAMVRECGWGEPEDIHRTTSVRRVDEQWVYGRNSYLYFTNGVLQSIQD